MMAKLPNDRPQSMKELAERLAPEMPADYGRPPSGLVRLSSEPTALTPPPAQPPTTLSGAAGQEISKHLSEMALPTRERTLKLTLAASLLFAGGIGALAFAIFSRHDPTPTARPNAPEPSISAPVVPPVPAAPAPAATFQVLVETEPPGAQVWSGAKSLGATPAKLTPVGDTMEIVLRMSGYREETLTLARDTEHAFVRLRREASTPKAKPAAPKKKPAIGLDD
jgi:hypothetical protein